MDIPLCGRLYLRGAIPDVCKHRADGAAYAGDRRTVRLGYDSIAMASYATRAWPGNFRVESTKVELGAVAESDHPYYFWIRALLFLSTIKYVCIAVYTQARKAANRLREERTAGIRAGLPGGAMSAQGVRPNKWWSGRVRDKARRLDGGVRAAQPNRRRLRKGT